ncbi:hypothetical protein, partial [Arcanobacterium canis]
MSATHSRFGSSAVTSRCTKSARVPDVFALPVVTGDRPLPLSQTPAKRIKCRVYSRPADINAMAFKGVPHFSHPI